MIDDPLAMIMYAVTVMAGGMYPIGFLFGPCSACCDECPPECSNCTHYVNNPGTCDIFRGDGRTLTVTADGQGEQTLTDPSQEPCTNDIGLINLAGQPIPSGLAPFGTPFICVSVIEGFATVDACGCNVCQASISLQARFEYDPDGSVVFGVTAVIDFDSCDTTTGTASVTGQWIELDNETDADVSELLSWVNALSVSVTVTIPACDCGACCDDGCEEDVAEGGCATWQGVGTDCDPDPCV